MDSNKIYIGKTKKSLVERQRAHKYRALSLNEESKFYRAIRKYGWERFEWSVLSTETTDAELNASERKYIAMYNSFRDGYNMTRGGDGGFTYNKETSLYNDIKHKLGRWKAGNPGATSSAIAKRQNTFRTTVWPTGTAHGNFGKHPTKPNSLGAKNHQAKIVQIDTMIFGTIRQAARFMCVSEKTISNRCKSDDYPNYSFYNAKK